MLSINNVHSVMTLHLDVLIRHHHKMLGIFTKSWSAEKYLVLHSHPFFGVTTSGRGLWTEYECKVSCMGGRNLYIGSFKEMNKHSAKGKACGWRLAGLPMEWRTLTGSAAIHKLQNRLCEAGWKHSLMSYMVQISSSAQRRACRAFHRQSTSCLLLCYPFSP